MSFKIISMSRNFVSERAMRKLPGEEMFKLAARCQDKDVISLALGEPDFRLPQDIFDISSDMQSSYTSPRGSIQLREAICKKLQAENKIPAMPDNIIATCGATEALLLATMATVNSGDEIIVQDPCFLIMPRLFEMFAGKVVRLGLKQEGKFEINPDDIKKLITEKTKIIVINSPSNPTGSTLKKKTLEEIADISIDNDLLVFSDEAYEKLVYDGEHCSIASLNGMHEHVVSFYTFSKTWSIPGFRLGYACAPDEITEAMTKLHPYTTFCAPSISQQLGTRILENAGRLKSYTDAMRSEYGKRRKFIVGELNSMGLETNMPEGAFYAFAGISGFSTSSVEFANFILDKANVAVVPGLEFGNCGEGYIRCSFATQMQNIEQAMKRMEDALA